MRKSISVRKRRRGRSATGTDLALGTRLPVPLMKALLQWAADNNVSKAEAARRLIEYALEHQSRRTTR